MLRLLKWWCRRYHKHAHNVGWKDLFLDKRGVRCDLCLRKWVEYNMEGKSTDETSKV